MKLISWNVNGIRAIYKKGFIEFVERERPDVLCVQETKADPAQVEPALLTPGNLKGYWSTAKRRGYSGVATFFRNEPEEVRYGISVEKFDSEGRFVISKHQGFTLFNIYFPNGGSGEERHHFKQEFLQVLNEHLRNLIEQGEQIVVLGDYNVAPSEIDVYDPVRLANESGFLPEERAWFDDFLKLGFVDTFRHFHPGVRDKYTWWSYRERARIGNRGWRIDHIAVTTGLIPHLKRMDILDRQEGSDHCPIVLEMDVE